MIQMLHKRINFVFLAISIFFWNSIPLSVHAEKYKIEEDEPLCHEIYSGGINWFDDEHAVQYEEIKDLEWKVTVTGEYVLANTDMREISDNAFEDLWKSCVDESTGCDNFYFAEYLNPENVFHDTYSKVYLYKPVFEEYIERWRNRSLENNPYIIAEMRESTVVIDYGIPYFIERIGADMSAEVNEGIPEWYQTGYLKVESPVSVMITLELMEEKNYYTFYVPKEETFYIKLKQGGYFVTKVNSQNTGDGEETLPYNDLIQITSGNETKENAYLLQLQAFAEKYNIQDLPAETQTIIETRNIYEDPFAEKTTIETEESDIPVLEQNPALFWAVCGLCGTALIVLAIISLKQKNRYPNEKGDNYEKPYEKP